MKVAGLLPYAPAVFNPHEIFLVVIFVRCWFRSQGYCEAGGSKSMKKRKDPIVNRACELQACSAVSLEGKNWIFIQNVRRFYYLNGLYIYIYIYILGSYCTCSWAMGLYFRNFTSRTLRRVNSVFKLYVVFWIISQKSPIIFLKRINRLFFVVETNCWDCFQNCNFLLRASYAALPISIYQINSLVALK